MNKMKSINKKLFYLYL